MNVLMQLFWVGLGGFAGAIARFGVGRLCLKWFGEGFPIGTLLINISGCFVLGWLMTWMTQRWPANDPNRLIIQMFLAVGFTGAYTTFSTFILESNTLFAGDQAFKAIGNILLSLILGFICLYAGIRLASR